MPAASAESEPSAQATPAEARPADSGLSVSFYTGAGLRAQLVDIVRFKDPQLQDRFIFAASGNAVIARLGPFTDLEVELNVARLSERADLWSVNAGFLLRWKRTPWESLMKSSFAVGDGYSYTSGIPDLEAVALDKTSRSLNWLVFEFAFPFSEKWEGLVRLHHRSGIFGLVANVIGGSDYLCMGARLRL